MILPEEPVEQPPFKLVRRTPEEKDAYMMGIIVENVLLKKQIRDANALLDEIEKDPHLYKHWKCDFESLRNILSDGNNSIGEKKDA